MFERNEKIQTFLVREIWQMVCHWKAYVFEISSHFYKAKEYVHSKQLKPSTWPI